jgi:hypothetical protein
VLTAGTTVYEDVFYAVLRGSLQYFFTRRPENGDHRFHRGFLKLLVGEFKTYAAKTAS